MKKRPGSWVGLSLLAMAAVPAGFWVGEGLEDAPAQSFGLLGLLLLAVTAVAALLDRAAWLKGLGAGAMVGLLSCAAFWVGERVAADAYNSCVERGDEIRSALEEFKSATGRYPDSLAELGQRLPGQRLLRPNILFYERRDDGYVLSFSDWLVEQTATETGSWDVRK